MVCDFCCTHLLPITWNYPARTFTVTHKIPGMTVNNTSHNNWACCAVCHDLIEENDRHALLERSVKTFFGNEGLLLKDVPEKIIEVIRGSIRELHDGFFTNRLGIAQRVRSDERH